VPPAFGIDGGKVVVSGVGDVDEDEFFLNLLNEQVCYYLMPVNGLYNIPYKIYCPRLNIFVADSFLLS